ncbi:MAG TPA: secretin N-terminal domain-containing protein [Pyrinomonadaceae bacterium]|jgi:general secretion pathway protein D
MKASVRIRSLASLVVIFCLLAAPMTAFAKKGEKHFKEGLKYEAAQQWERAAEQFTLAVAADPSNTEYQLHYRRAVFNASQQYMQQGRSLAEQRDYVGGYNAFRQAYAYDPVNQLALSEMERMLRLQREKEENGGTDEGNGNGNGPRIAPTSLRQQGGGSNSGDLSPATPRMPSTTRALQQEQVPPPTTTERLRVITYSGDLKQFIRNLATELGLNVIFDTQSFRQARTIEVNLRDVTTAQALDYIFLQENLFFQKISRRTILVADQTRRPQYQQLVIRTFYLSNIDPQDARNLITAAIPPNQGRPQAIVLPDKATNSITVRDTAENIRLIGEILQSIDKDRAEVVMDVSIYEVSSRDLMQFGNQVGSADGSVIALGGSSGVRAVGGSQQVANQVFGSVPTAIGAAILLPASTLQALQDKSRSRLLASTQVHAFNGEESSARIGQRVPVQTAQTYPFGNFNQTPTTGGGTGTTGGVFSGGFPVIQYEPTGLTLKFTPQVFPNLDVQVKMSIESKDILGAGSLTPTFTERTLTGTARIQNNRTMMLASVAQDTQSNGRRGLPLLGLIPILGRLFTAPTRNNNKTDIVIAVTPRVLRAPAVTPRDELMRPSGTLQTPTSGSLEAMVQEAEREEQLALARRPQNNTVAQGTTAAEQQQPAYVPAPQAALPENTTTAAATTATTTTAQPGNALATTTTPANNVQTPSTPQQGSLDVASALAQYVDAASLNTSSNGSKSVETTQPVSLSLTPPQPTTATPSSAQPSEAIANAKQETAATPSPAYARPATTTTAKPPAVDKIADGLFGNAPATQPSAVTVELRLMPAQQEMRVGEKQKLALTLISNTPFNSAMMRLRFDPRFIVVRGISQGDVSSSAPTVMQSIDPSGIVTISVMPPAGVNFKTGANVLVFLEIEAVAAGESVLGFEKNNVHLSAAGVQAMPQLFESRIVVK